MSYTFRNTDKRGETRQITILERDEFIVLNDEEKLDYQSGPKIKEDEEEKPSLNTLHIQGLIYDIIHEEMPNGIANMLEEFMEANYIEKYNEGSIEYPLRSDREEFFWNFIDTEGGDGAQDDIDLFIVNQFYKNDHLYSVLIDKCSTIRKNSPHYSY